jgi:phosphoenolpyruvate synthase/pyruvate phosphate dikinase
MPDGFVVSTAAYRRFVDEHALSAAWSAAFSTSPPARSSPSS